MSATSDKRMRRKVRRSYVISTISIALVLFILGAVSYVTLSAITAAESLRERVIVSVEIADELDKEAKRAILKQIKGRDEVLSVDYMSKEEVIEFLKEEMTEIEKEFNNIDDEEYTSFLSGQWHQTDRLIEIFESM